MHHSDDAAVVFVNHTFGVMTDFLPSAVGRLWLTSFLSEIIYFDNGDQLCKINLRQMCCYGYPWVMKVQSRLWYCCHEVAGHGLPDLWPALLWGVKECCAFPELFKASKLFFSMSPQGWFKTTTYSVLITHCSEQNTLLFFLFLFFFKDFFNISVKRAPRRFLWPE